jgi:Do/DeqQ family serine protease
MSGAPRREVSRMTRGIDKSTMVRWRLALPALATLFAFGLWTATMVQAAGRGVALLKQLDEAYVEIWEKVAPAVVNVDTIREITLPGPSPRMRRFFDDFDVEYRDEPRTERRPGRGSGFVIDKQGHVLTNLHVVEGADTIEVRFSKEEEKYKATLVGTDSETEIALIKIEPRGDLPVVPLGDSEKLRVGQIVMAIGNPAGVLERTFTVGHVSGLGRFLPEFAARMRLASRDFIQTDAAITFGNSGGPLVNVDGEVIGINTAWAPGGENLGFAVPINFAKEILPDLKQRGKAYRGHLGVTVLRIESGVGNMFGLPDDTGALVDNVVPGSPADKAGLQRYDVITEVNRQKISSSENLVEVVTHLRPGTTVRVTFFRDQRRKSVRVKLADRSEETVEEEAIAEAQPEETLGMTVDNITSDLAQRFEVREEKGVVVTGVDLSGPAVRKGVRPGDVILEINRKPVENVAEFRKAVGEVEPRDQVMLLLSRKGERSIVFVRKPQAAK